MDEAESSCAVLVAGALLLVERLRPDWTFPALLAALACAVLVFLERNVYFSCRRNWRMAFPLLSPHRTNLRRVVTGHNPATGHSCIAYDGPPAAVNQGLAEIWSQLLPANNELPPAEELARGWPGREGPPTPSSVVLHPHDGGTTFRWFVIRRKSPWAAVLPTRFYNRFIMGYYDKSFELMGASNIRGNVERFPGMHKTTSLDYIIVVKGTGTLVMEEGEVTLRQGDVVVQRGTDHAWKNDSYFRPFVAAAVLMPAISPVGAIKGETVTTMNCPPEISISDGVSAHCPSYQRKTSASETHSAAAAAAGGAVELNEITTIDSPPEAGIGPSPGEGSLARKSNDNSKEGIVDTVVRWFSNY